MKIITYLAFTVLSVVIQFVVMDFIQEKIKVDDDLVELNVTSTKKHFKDILQQYTSRPHALYYRTPDGTRVGRASKVYSNSSIEEVTLESSTDFSTTIFDLIDNDNTSTTEDDITESTESLYTTTELDNVTEITLFGVKNNTENVKPKIEPKKTMSKDCNCNLLYKVCDINCCCDSDCAETERKMFLCTASALNTIETDQSCYSPFMYHSYSIGANIEALFCLAKSNLPDKRNIVHYKHDPSVLNKSFKWHVNSKQRAAKEFTKSFYKYGDSIWLLKNGSVYYVDMPSPALNNYCNERKPIRFLKQQNIKCKVNLSDLEILQILGTVEETAVISVIEKTLNTSTLNCSTLHCTNWTINLCEEGTCTKYNKSLHDPLCTDNICTHLALKVDYIFYYYDNKIMNASVTLHTQKLTLNVPFIVQEISVKFVIANESVDQIVEFSGSPGYIVGLPVIVSYSEGNYTVNFLNDTSKFHKYLSYPNNENGACIRSNKTNSFVLFGTNKRIKCRYYHTQKVQKRNESEVCRNIQRNINLLSGFDNKIAVSPLGNPHGVSDENWIVMQKDTPETILYGQFNKDKTKLHCYNLVTRLSQIFTFADSSDGTTKNKITILSAKVESTPSNITLDLEGMSLIVTVDTIFIDETKPSVFEYAGSPQLNIHLPRDFFFPFPSNTVPFYACNKYLILFCVTLLINK